MPHDTEVMFHDTEVVLYIKSQKLCYISVSEVMSGFILHTS